MTSLKTDSPTVEHGVVELLPISPHFNNVSESTSHITPTDRREIVDDAPDGGYGWIIAAACSVLCFFFVGLSYSWGVMQARLATENLAADSTLAFIGSTAVSCVSFGAVLNGRLIRHIGTRKSALVASILMGSGLILSGWATRSVPGLFITNGLIMGYGISVAFMAGGTLPSQYFAKKRGIANGIVFAGGGIGGAVLSVSMQALLNRVGVAWTFRILGFVTLATTIPAAMLLKERTRRASSSIEWSLFQDPKFVLLFVGSGIATFPLLVPPFFIPLYASSIGTTAGIGSVLAAVYNLSSACGRVGFGFLGDYIGPTSSLALSMVIAALSMLVIWPVSTSIAPFIAFTVINGVGNGGFFSTIPSVVGHIYGPTRVPPALAMVVTAWAAGYFMGAPVAGYILERYGGAEVGQAAFRPVMYYAGSMSLASAMIIFAIRHQMTRNFFAFA